jgi:hypothetical protein
MQAPTGYRRTACKRVTTNRNGENESKVRYYGTCSLPQAAALATGRAGNEMTVAVLALSDPRSSLVPLTPATVGLAGDKLARDPPLSAGQPGGKFPLGPTVAKVADAAASLCRRAGTQCTGRACRLGCDTIANGRALIAWRPVTCPRDRRAVPGADKPQAQDRQSQAGEECAGT